MEKEQLERDAEERYIEELKMVRQRVERKAKAEKEAHISDYMKD